MGWYFESNIFEVSRVLGYGESLVDGPSVEVYKGIN